MTKILLALLLSSSVAAQTLPCTGTLSISAAGVVSGTCTGGAPPTQPPSGCGITGLPNGPQTAPYTYTLGASCSGGGAPSAWQWSGGSSATSAGITGNVSTTTSFAVVVSNAAGAAPQAHGTITIQGTGPIVCAGYVNTRIMDLNWNSTTKGVPILGYTNQIGGFGPKDAIVVRFTTPAGTAVNVLGWVGAAEYQSSPATIYGKLSASACDFIPPSAGQSISQYFSVGTNSYGATALQPSTTYYFNMHHDSSCTASSCDDIVTLQKPQGL